MNVENKRSAGRAASLQSREIGQPVVRMNDVESLASRDPASHLGVAQDLRGEIRPVVPDKGRVGAQRGLSLLGVLDLGCIGAQQRGDAAEPQEKPLAMGRIVAGHRLGGIHDRETRVGRREGVARQNEHDLRAGPQKPSHEPLGRDTQSSADDGRKLPAEHEDAHKLSAVSLQLSAIRRDGDGPPRANSTALRGSEIDFGTPFGKSPALAAGSRPIRARDSPSMTAEGSRRS